MIWYDYFSDLKNAAEEPEIQAKEKHEAAWNGIYFFSFCLWKKIYKYSHLMLQQKKNVFIPDSLCLYDYFKAYLNLYATKVKVVPGEMWTPYTVGPNIPEYTNECDHWGTVVVGT